MRWIAGHPTELQALSSIALTLLTFVLIVLTGIYARANWRTMRLVEADIVRFRTQPIPAADITIATMGMRRDLLFIVVISTANAPLRLENVSIFLTFADESTHVHSFTFEGYRTIPVGDSVDLRGNYAAKVVVKKYHTTITYRDLGGSIRYMTTVVPAPFPPGESGETITTKVLYGPRLLSRAIALFKRT